MPEPRPRLTAARRSLAIVIASVAPGCGRSSGCDDGPSPIGFIASADRWVRVAALGAAPDGVTSPVISSSVVPFADGVETGVLVHEDLGIHLEYLDEVTGALARDADVFAAFVASRGDLEHEVVPRDPRT